MSHTDLLVLGAGPGGYAAAFLAADLGMKVTMVDSDANLGGVCLNRGCIPSKALLHIAKLINETREARGWGLDFGEPRIDLEKLGNWKNEVIGKMSGGLTTLARQRNVTVIRGKGVFLDSHTLEVSGKEKIAFDHCVLATGSRPIIPEMFSGLDSVMLDSTSALELDVIPGSLLIVGGGYIGLEMGTVYAALGSRVTVVEMTSGLLPGVDRDLVRLLQARLKKDFENILLDTKVVDAKNNSQGVTVVLESSTGKTEETFDRILVAVGRQPNSNGIGLESTQVKMDAKGFVHIDDRQISTDPAILAIGDVVGGAMLAHKASAEAHVAVETVSGQPGKFDYRAVPAVVFTDPEIAWCGLTETEARQAGREIKISKFPWGGSGRAQTLGRPDGSTKMILDPETDRILGVGIVGSGAGELISEAVLAIEMGAVAQDLAFSIHPHPTLSETLKEAAEAYLGKSPHSYKKK
ncbi:MAG: dihydrolipoyl dehydrogenase [Nitrospinaceae bacterium]|nr:MAG: dihydrolipoyl dehydrogenase [Nitrospinaceae bacterium]